MDQSQTRRQVYDFYNDLTHSNREGIKEVWVARHMKYFNDRLILVLNDSTNAKKNDQGIDMRLWVPSHNKAYNMEHKEHFGTRFKDDIIHVEYMHVLDNGERKPGWIEDNNKKTDILAYYKHAIDTTFYWEWDQLRKAWTYFLGDWIGRYDTTITRNKYWDTYCLKIPAKDLYEAIEWIINQGDSLPSSYWQ